MTTTPKPLYALVEKWRKPTWHPANGEECGNRKGHCECADELEQALREWAASLDSAIAIEKGMTYVHLGSPLHVASQQICKCILGLPEKDDA